MDGLRIEHRARFKTWHKCIISSILGIVLVDVFLGFSLEGGTQTYGEFWEDLAHKMVENKLDRVLQGNKEMQKRRVGRVISKAEWDSSIWVITVTKGCG